MQVKRLVGYLPDTVGFYDHMTAIDNLRYTAGLIGIPAAERDARIASALDRVGLGDVAQQARRHVLPRHAAAARASPKS